MSANLNRVETQWLAQLSAMRAAIAELKLPADLENVPAYGQDVWTDEEDSSEPTSGDDDLWDLVDDDEEEDQAFLSDSSHPVHETTPSPAYGAAWLHERLSYVSSSMSVDELQDHIVAILGSDSSDDELQMLLADTLGFDELDLVAEFIAHRKEIATAVQPPVKSQPNGRILSRREREAALEQQDFQHKTASLAAAQDRSVTQYPHVYRAHDAGNMLSSHGRKYMLPLGSERTEHEKYEEYSIPPAKVGTLGLGQSLVMIKDMDTLCQGTFKGYKSLNRMQSLVYPVAYKTSENMLICAPTGAGKTDAAMLTILNTIAKNVTPSPFDDPNATDLAVALNDFKIVYVAPMKALAAEITEKLGKRLAWLGVQCRELTGDMHLTKAEIVATQIIVTTPEKWDVVTRKSTGDTELVQKVRLLIIDEVHMLHDERGAVL
ncbi:Sec63-domain-containing protein, partial [Aureobasidium melanogenum]